MNSKLILLTFCVDPGCWRKTAYGIFSDIKETLAEIKEQIRVDPDSLIYGQRVKLHIIQKGQNDIWTIENSLDLEPYFQADYKGQKFHFNEKGLRGNYSSEFKELSQILEEDNLPADEIEDLKISLIKEDEILKFLDKSQPFANREKVKILAPTIIDLKNDDDPNQPFEINPDPDSGWDSD